MQPSENPQSLLDVIRSRQASAFVGREGPLASFMDNLSRGAQDPLRVVIFAVDGQAGVGKSYLTRRLCADARRVGDLAAISDNDTDDVLVLLDSISGQLHSDTGEFANYAQLSKKYRQRRDSMVSDPNAPDGLATVLTNASVRIGLGAAKVVPGVNNILDGIEPQVAAEQVEALRNYLAKQLRRASDGELILNPIPTLTARFLADLRRASVDFANVILAIDTFERRSDRVQRWLLATLNGMYGPVPLNLLLIVAGQHPLDANEWSEFNAITERYSLREFTPGEISALLRAYGATDNSTVASVMQLTGGLPVLVAMLTADANRPINNDQAEDAAETAVERFLKHEQNVDLRNLILKVSVARWFDSSVLNVLTDGDQGQDVLSWLTKFPFVKKQGSRWVFHGVVRTMMIRFQRDRDPDLQRSVHEKLAAHHVAMADRHRARSGQTRAGNGNLFDQHDLEATYHLLCAENEATLSATLRRIGVESRSRAPILDQIVGTLLDAANDLPSASYREIYDEIYPLTTGEMSEFRGQLLTYLISKNYLSDIDAATLYRARAIYRLYQERSFELALYDFNKSISLGDDRREMLTRGFRAEAFERLNRYDEALDDLNWCLSQKDDDGYTLQRRHTLFVELEDYEAAERDINAAIVAEPSKSYHVRTRANFFFVLHRDDEAIRDYSRAMELDGTNSALRHRAEAYRFMRRYPEALADLDQLIGRDTNFQDLVRRGEVLRLLGRPDEAVEDATRGAAGNDILGWAHLSLGLIHRDRADHRRADASFRKAVETGVSYLRQDPEDVAALFNTSMAYAVLEMHSHARELLNELIRVGFDLERTRQAQTLYQELREAGVAQAPFVLTLLSGAERCPNDK